MMMVLIMILIPVGRQESDRFFSLSLFLFLSGDSAALTTAVASRKDLLVIQ